jgi:hypothetical protein
MPEHWHGVEVPDFEPNGPGDRPTMFRLRWLRERYGTAHPATEAAFRARMDEVLAEERASNAGTGLWYLSFVDDASGAWLGACYVSADGMAHAVGTAHALGCNPGGRVGTVLVPPDLAVHVQPADRNRLLNKDDIDRMDRTIKARRR